MKKLAAIVVTHNSNEVINNCLDSLTATKSLEIIVVDCNSSDGTTESVSKRGVSVLNLRNVGFGRANNIGVSNTTSEYLLFCNPDTIFPPSTIPQLYEQMQKVGRDVIIGPSFKNEGKNYTDEKINIPDYTECKKISGAFFIIKRDVFLNLQGFDENIFLFFEETDLMCRARKKGIAVLRSNNVWVQHLVGKSSPQSAEYMFIKSWHTGWSRCYFARKHFSNRFYLWFGAVLFTDFLSMLKSLFKGKREKLTKKKFELMGLLACFRGEKAFEGSEGRFSK